MKGIWPACAHSKRILTVEHILCTCTKYKPNRKQYQCPTVTILQQLKNNIGVFSLHNPVSGMLMNFLITQGSRTEFCL